MTNLIAATVAVFLHTNVSESFVSPAGDAKARRVVIEEVSVVTWKRGTNTFTAEVSRGPQSTNFSILRQQWSETPKERVPLGVPDKITPPKR